VFAEDLDGQLTFDVKKFEKQITQILKSMELEETFHSKNGKHKGWKIASLTPRR
jgi:hypothetical protein